MAVTQTGSAVVIQNSNNTGSQSVTVPADANFLVLLASGWNTSAFASFFLNADHTLNSVSLNHSISWRETNNFGHTGIYYLANPSTGSQTFAWDWGDTQNPGEGMNMVLVFLKGVDTTEVPDKGSANDGSDVTGLTSGYMIGCVYDYAAGTLDVTDNGQTEVAAPARFNSCYIAVGAKDGATGFYYSGGEYQSACAITLQAVPGTGHELTLKGLESSAPALDSLTITQDQDLAFDILIAGTPELDTTIIGQTHVQSFDVLEVASPVLDSLSLTQDQQATLDNLMLAAPINGEISLTQDQQILLAQLALSAPALDEISIDQDQQISLEDAATSSPALDELDATQNHQGTLEGFELGEPVLDQISATQRHVLGLSDLATGSPVLDELEVSIAGEVNFDDLVTGQPSLDEIQIDQSHALLFNGLETGQPNLPALNHTQNQQADLDDLSVGQPVLGGLSVSQRSIVSLSDLILGEPTLDEINATQNHQVALEDLATGEPVLGGMEVTLNQYILGSLETDNPELDSVSISQVHELTLKSQATGQPVLDTLSINSEFATVFVQLMTRHPNKTYQVPMQIPSGQTKTAGQLIYGSRVIALIFNEPLTGTEVSFEVSHNGTNYYPVPGLTIVPTSGSVVHFQNEDLVSGRWIKIVSNDTEPQDRDFTLVTSPILGVLYE